MVMVVLTMEHGDGDSYLGDGGTYHGDMVMVIVILVMVVHTMETW